MHDHGTCAWICGYINLLGMHGGPDQPEVQSFTPIGTSEMVDPFTGDFSYNIPLMDVDGYPINMAYSAGVTMDQEASWVGLGWNLNPGVVNRSMRGLPDDFNGLDSIKKNMNLKWFWVLVLILMTEWVLLKELKNKKI